MGTTLKVAVTGSAGQIAYNLLFRIASGEVFGSDQPVELRLLEVAGALDALRGVVMELEDCAYPLLKGVVTGSDPRQVFEGADWVLLVGAKPRGPGMERADLLRENAPVFVEQGKALNGVASREARVVIVGNPSNTNALIVMNHAPLLQRDHITSMSRLDQNRARALMAKKAGVAIEEVDRLVVWGNHSSTQVPDFLNARIKGRPALEFLDREWCEGEFIRLVQQRGSEVIQARGRSSAASAANALIDHVHGLVRPTKEGDSFSIGVPTNVNPYGLAEDIVFSLPCTSEGKGEWKISDFFTWDDFLKNKILESQNELIAEWKTVASEV